MKARFNGDVGTGIILLIVEAVFYYLSFGFINPAAARWPQGVLLVSAIFSILLIIHGLRAKDYTAPVYKSIKGPWLAVVVMVLYGVAMYISGFFAATLVFCPLGMYLLGQRSWKILVGVPVGLDVFVYVLFVMQLQLEMP